MPRKTSRTAKAHASLSKTRRAFASLSVLLTLARVSVCGQTVSTNTPAKDGSTTNAPSGKMQEVVVTGSYLPVIPTEPIESVIGFNKSILDTPRSVTVLSAEVMNAAGVENVEDLYRVAPSTYTNFRFGLQGGINVRNQAADYYFRGMKKPDPQGNYRTIFTAFDSIEVVRGPASPIFGGGRIGGYLNFNPNTARSGNGKYMSESEGKVSFSTGWWDKRVATIDYGGPLKGLPGGRKAGYYFYGLFEDSGSFYEGGFDKHLVGQLAISADLSDRWRLETGVAFQNSRGGLNGGINRITDEFFSQGKYWRGGFAVQLDANRDGKISERELFASRPAGATYNPITVNFGTISSKPTFKQTVDATGMPTGPIRRVDTGAIIGSGTATLTTMPPAFQVDPASFQLVDVDYSKQLGEDHYRAEIFDAYLDLIDDARQELKLKNQIYFHTYDQWKVGRNPFSQNQAPSTLEEKFTATHEANAWMPEWIQGQFLASANIRFSDTFRENSNGDYDRRRDLMSGPGNGFSPNDTFFSFDDVRGLDGSAITTYNSSQYVESGIGVLTDQIFWEKINLTAGGRFDYVFGEFNAPAGIFNKAGADVGTTANIANRLSTAPVHASGSDSEWSWSGSLAYLAPFKLRPYVTIAEQAALLVNTSDASIVPANWARGPYAKSQLYEVGMKWAGFEDRLFASVAAYEQTRIAFSQIDGEDSVNKTRSQGVELELRYSPVPSVSVVGSAIWNKARYLSGATVTVNGRFVGFSDVIDPATGRVVVPAEAFGWGGVPQVTIADGSFTTVEGIPDKILNLFVTYNHAATGLGIAGGVSYQGGFYADRTQIYHLPAATVFNSSLFYNRGKWQAKLDFNNITDERYYTRGPSGGIMIGVRQPFSVDFTLARSF